MKPLHAISLACALLLGSPALSQAQRSTELRVATATAFNSIDPHFFVSSANVTIAKHIFDALVGTDEAMKPIPGLALSWRTLDDSRWEFKLRPDVRFSDGAGFDAEDVIAALERAPNVEGSPSSFALYTRSIKSVTAPDPLTVVIETKWPNPTLPIELSYVLITPKKVAKAATAEFNTGAAAIGTGPFKFRQYTPNDRLVLERNDLYWGKKPDWTTVTIRLIPNNGARTAALLAGDVDVIDSVPPADIGRLERSNFKLATAVSNRVTFIGMDHARDVSPRAVSKKTGKNPLLDLRVRQALTMAINRQAIAERIMNGQAIVADQMLPKGYFGVDDALQPLPYDPERARALLKEAGFENDIKLTLFGPTERYLNASQVMQTVAQMFGRIGVEAEVELMPWSTYISRLAAGDASLFLSGWGSVTGEVGQSLLVTLATQNAQLGSGGGNRGRYSNPKLDEALQKALSTMDNAERHKLLAEAGAIAQKDAAYLPLYFELFGWAYKPGLKMAGRSDQSLLSWLITAE